MPIKPVTWKESKSTFEFPRGSIAEYSGDRHHYYATKSSDEMHELISCLPAWDGWLFWSTNSHFVETFDRCCLTLSILQRSRTAVVVAAAAARHTRNKATDNNIPTQLCCVALLPIAYYCSSYTTRVKHSDVIIVTPSYNGRGNTSHNTQQLYNITMSDCQGQATPGKARRRFPQEMYRSAPSLDV